MKDSTLGPTADLVYPKDTHPASSVPSAPEPSTSPPQLRPIYHMGSVTSETAIPDGSTPVDLRTLPRDTPEQHEAWLTHWLQGVAEGTIFAQPEQIKAVELQMKSLGMLVNKSERTDKTLIIQGTLDEVLEAFGVSQRLRTNTTIRERSRQE